MTTKKKETLKKIGKGAIIAGGVLLTGGALAFSWLALKAMLAEMQKKINKAKMR